jgi:molybdopterin converting factor subunit 1
MSAIRQDGLYWLRRRVEGHRDSITGGAVRVRVRLFAGLKELIGQEGITVDLPEGASVGDLRERLRRDLPRLAPFLPSLVCAVNEEYRLPEYPLHDGDEVALIPPISGGRPCLR